MNGFTALFRSSVGKKYLMAISGVILTGFVLGHMLGNLQFFLHPDWLNEYAHHLQNIPYGGLWVVRLILLAAVVIHIWTGIVLTKQNRAARPGYALERTVQASKASRTMIWSGLIIAAFIIFHILHFTTRDIYDYDSLPLWTLGGDAAVAAGAEVPASAAAHGLQVPDVHAMMYLGFSKWYVSLFYIIAVGLLMMHLTHGVSSMFQSVGMRNEQWRYRLDKFATAYGWIVFLGFAVIPVAVMLDLFNVVDLFDTTRFQSFLDAMH